MKQLRKMFARCSDIAFLQLIWATDALQSDRVEAASRLITFPPQAADSSIGSPFAIHRWELETLTIQLFLTPKQEINPEGGLILDCSKFEAIREAVNRLRSLENVESAFYLDDDFNILSEMHRIAQRQFHWQRGYFNLPQLYRYMFIYGQGQCAEYFQHRYGLRSSELALAAFAYFATCQRLPWLSPTAVPNVGLTHDIVDRAIPMLSISLPEARRHTMDDVARINEQHGRPVPTAYLPSVLRRSPLIRHQERADRFIAPIPEIILMRATSGLYYDLIGGGQAILNEANDRFEQYCVRYVATMMPRFTVERAFRYGPQAFPVDTPDVLVRDAGRVVLAAECKATKLTYLAQFAEDPFEAQTKQYRQIARGMFQLWRYFSHVRRGILALEVAPKTYAMVVTLDPFVMMSRSLRASIINEAQRLADEDGNIDAEDRRHIIICPVAELEQILHTSNEDAFLASLEAAQEERYFDWQFREIHRDTEWGRQFTESRRFPFDLGDLLPWWTQTQSLADEWARQRGPFDSN
jgi:hypothetical protein